MNIKLIDPDAVKVRDVPFTYGPQYELTYRRKKKKTHNLEDVMPTGVDDGKGARKLLNTYVDETLTVVKPHNEALVNFDMLSDDFRNKPFLDQINHVQMRGIPLLSQVARQDALWPYNSTKKKKHYIAFAKRLQRNDTGLLHARLSSESIDDGIIKIMEYALQKNTVLQHLALHKNSITDKGIEMICLAIRWHPTLHTLWLGANPFCDIGARHISMLLSRNRNIKELNISNRWPSEIWQKNLHELHPHITYVGAQYIAKQLQRGSGLISLSLSEQRVRDDGAIYLFQALKNCHLRVLNLRENELSDRCCVELRAALEGRSGLEELILSHNQISDEGAINIAYGLARNTTLHVLDLGYNQIGAAGLDALFLCLKYNQSLTALITVRNNDLDCRAEELVHNRVSSVFSFGGGQVGNQGKSNGLLGAGAATPPRIKRIPSSSGAVMLSLELSVPQGVEILGKSVHSRSFRTVHIDSNEASRSNSVRSNSFRALSQRFDVENDIGDKSDVEKSGSRPTTPAAPMLGGSNRPRNPSPERLGTPPAPMLGSNKVRVPSERRKGSGSPQHTDSLSLSPSKRGIADVPLPEPTSPGFSGSPGGAKLKANRKSRSVSMLLPTGNISEDEENRGPSPLVIDVTKQDKQKEDQIVVAPPQAPEAKVTSSPPPGRPKLLKKNSSKKFFTSFRQNLESEEVRELPEIIKQPPAALFDLGRPVKSREVGKTISIPNVKNMGIRPIRTSISPLKDSAQHLMYLRISTPFDSPDERPYSILNVGRDHLEEVARVKKQRQHPKYKYDKAFKIHNTPKVIRHQAAMAKVPPKFWAEWQTKIRLQYKDGIDNAPGVTSTKLDVVTPREVEEPLGDAQHGLLSRSSTADSVASLVAPPVPLAPVQAARVPSRDGPLRRSILTTTSSDLNEKNEKNEKAVMRRVGGVNFADDTDFGPTEPSGFGGVGSSKVSGSSKVGFGASSKYGDSSKFGPSGKFGASAKLTASAKASTDPSLDPNSAYYIYANDPSQAYRKHLTFKNNGVTPGRILAARRKENALQRQKKIDDALAEKSLIEQMESTTIKHSTGFVISNTSMKVPSKSVKL